MRKSYRIVTCCSICCFLSTNTILYQLLLVFSLHSRFSVRAEVVTVQTKQGFLAGSSYFSRNGTRFYAFLGIPYARPPIGDLRFKPPEEAAHWYGVKDAFFPPPICLQNNVLATEDRKAVKVLGQEDCLYLNVHTPTLDKNANLAVLVWIHGGAFLIGSANMYNPYYLMDHSAVVVIINYRLGVLGFLSMCDKDLPGNYGMKDQVMALKWIQENIRAFGGDPNKVTIFGQSSGGASVDFHLRSPLSKDLFRRAISHSGSALSMWAQTPYAAAVDRARAVAVLCGCRTSPTSSMTQCLKTIPAEELIETQLKLRVWYDDPLVLFGVVVEPEMQGAFLTRDPWQQRHIISPVPWIIGFTSGEGGFRVTKFLSDGADIAKELDVNSDRYFPLIFDYNYRVNDDQMLNISRLIRRQYFNDEGIGLHTSTQMVDAITDGFFAHNIIESALGYPGKVYMYFYDHQNQYTFNEIVKKCDQNLGVGHGDDLLSFFSFPFVLPDISSAADLKVSEQVIEYWINFANKGDPNTDNEIWLPLQSSDVEFLHITSQRNQMRKEFLRSRYEFWRNLKITYTNEHFSRPNNDEL